MKCFHHTDGDGYCSAAIVHRYMPDMEFIPMNYTDPFPFEKIKEKEYVVIVDFSLSEEDFRKLLTITNNNVVWIDHHKTAIEKHKSLRVAGIRQDGIAACELTWKYYFPDEDVPKAVRLLGDYDVWKFAYGEDTNYFQAAYKLYDHSIGSPLWDKWLGDSQLEEELECGRVALLYRNNTYAALVKHSSFYTSIEGHRAICCNALSVSSQLFDTIDPSTYDIMVAFGFTGEKWTVSLYTKRDIDVSEIAKKYGGGGHRQAAGFVTDLPTLNKILRYKLNGGLIHKFFNIWRKHGK